MDPEADYKTFGVVEEDGRTILRLHGTKEQRAKVEADKVHIIMDAIARGWDIDVQYADIEGDLDIRTIVDELEKDENARCIIRGEIKIWHSEMNGYVHFTSATFMSKVDFKATFTKDVSFGNSAFNEDICFGQKRLFRTDLDFQDELRIADLTNDFENHRLPPPDDIDEQTNHEDEGGRLRRIWSLAKDGNRQYVGKIFGKEDIRDDKREIIIYSYGTSTFEGSVSFRKAVFNKEACFRATTFNGKSDFRAATFSGEYACFSLAKFTKEVSFNYAIFNGRTSFRSADFGDARLEFGAVVMKRPATFENISYRNASIINKYFRKKYAKFLMFDTNTVMDASSNPRLKRYIDDEQWIESWRRNPEGRWWREHVFRLWELTSHCGRSIGLWVFWSALIAVGFAFIYQAFGGDSITFSLDMAGKLPDLRSYLYYSVVTFTTLGFGDIIPKTNWARLAVGAEVVLGYVMLGGLISIFANKLARRS